MAEAFTDNAVGTLAAGISDTDTAITLLDEVWAHNFAAISSGSGNFQRATITVPSSPFAFEIVRVVETADLGLTIVRGQEGTVAQTWPAGAKISARVTAGMLQAIVTSGLQPDAGVGRKFKTDDGKFVVNGRISASYNAAQVAGFHALQPVKARIDWSNGLGSGHIDQNMTRESVGATAFVHLGDNVPATWTAGNTYGDGAWVASPTATGHYYFLEIDPDVGEAYSTTTTPPAFDEFGSCPVALNGALEVGQWVSVPTPLLVPQNFPGGTRVMVTEVGFICFTHGATAGPSVSIGTSSNPTRFANNVALSQIAGDNHVHRIPIADGGEMVYNLRFKVETPATGTFYGRFYWRGLIVGLP